jgi:hypothetical protein
MALFRQIEANRRNAAKSTGSKTDAGKQQSRRNAVRHGLTAETVIGALEEPPLPRITTPNRPWSGNWCSAWPVYFGGCAAPPPWKPAYSRSRPKNRASSTEPLVPWWPRGDHRRRRVGRRSRMMSRISFAFLRKFLRMITRANLSAFLRTLAGARSGSLLSIATSRATDSARRTCRLRTFSEFNSSCW